MGRALKRTKRTDKTIRPKSLERGQTDKSLSSRGVRFISGSETDTISLLSVFPNRADRRLEVALTDRSEAARPFSRATALGASRWLIYFSERLRAGADLADVLDEVIAWGLKTRERVKG
jgi:hypothetical protein